MSVKVIGLVTDGQDEVSVPSTSDVSAKQDTLVSGANIKTINNSSIVGSGNLSVVPYFTVYSQTNLSINGNNGQYFICTISANASFTLSNITTGIAYYIRVYNSSAGLIYVTIPTTADIKANALVSISATTYREFAFLYDGTNRTWQISEEMTRN